MHWPKEKPPEWKVPGASEKIQPGQGGRDSRLICHFGTYVKRLSPRTARTISTVIITALAWMKWPWSERISRIVDALDERSGGGS